MSLNEWESRWQENRIGFHLEAINPLLIRNIEFLMDAQPDTIFIPLSGKSKDMVWLAEKIKKVVGIELIDKAVKSFYEENQLEYSSYDAGKLQLYSSDSIDTFQGDFFDLGFGHTRPFEVMYDRAALIALPANERQKYVDHLMEFLVKDGKLLLITLDYNQSKMSGPPYAVTDEEVNSLFSGYGNLKRIETQDILNDRFRSKGLDWMTETVYQFVKN